MIELNNCYNLDCLEGMQQMINQGLKADWCITDPPYGIDYTSMTGGGGNAAQHREYSKKTWDSKRIDFEYFDLIKKCSNNQIIFGGNYYTDYFPPTKSWLIWNKRANDMHIDFADCELAWCSQGVARVINYLYMGMIQQDTKNKDPRFHPTQKPTQLWTKILNLYTKTGDIILDPFAGSQSLRIACHKLQRKYIGFEIDKEYFDKGLEWFKQYSAQLSIFDS